MLRTARVAPLRLMAQWWRIGKWDLVFVLLDSMGSSSGFPLIGSRSLAQRSFFGTGEEYVNAPEKSTSRILSWREIFEHGTESYSVRGERLKVVFKVLFCPTREWDGRLGQEG